MKFLTEITRHCVSNMEASQGADSVAKHPNGVLQNGFISSKGSKHQEDEKIAKAKLLKKKLLTQRRRRRRRSTLSESDKESSDGQEGVDSDLSEGELDGLLNETLSDDDVDDISDLSSLSDDEEQQGKGKILMNGRNGKGREILGLRCLNNV